MKFTEINSSHKKIKLELNSESQPLYILGNTIIAITKSAAFTGIISQLLKISDPVTSPKYIN